MQPLEVDWQQMAQRRMPPMRIVPTLDDFVDGTVRLGPCAECAPAQQLTFQGSIEPLRHGIVEAVPDTAHRRPYTGFLTAPAEYVQHHRQVQKALPGRHIGDVRHPQPIRGLGGKRPLHQVRCRSNCLVAGRRAATLAAAGALQALGLHQLRHPFAADLFALSTQFGVNARGTIGPARARVDRLDLVGQLGDPPRPGRLRTIQPRIEPARGDTEQPAHRGNRVIGPIHLHELEDFGGTESVSARDTCPRLLPGSPVPA